MKWKPLGLAGLLIVVLLAACMGGPAPAPGGPLHAIKIITSESGIYQVTSADLAAAGMQVTDPQRLHLRYRGQEQPLWLAPASRAGEFELQFYAVSSASRYALNNVYWLVAAEPNPRLNPSAPSDFQAAAPTAAPVQASLGRVIRRFEENKLYTPAPQKGEHWFWLNLNAPGRQVIPFTLDAPFSGEVTFRLEVWSNTSGEGEFDHHLRASLNGQAILDETWKGAGEHHLGASLAAPLLKAGSNELLIELPGIADTPAESIWINCFEWSGARLLQARSGQVNFEALDSAPVLTGFNGDTWIYALGDPLQPARQALRAGAGGSVEIRAPTGRQVWAVDRGGLKKGQIETPALSPDWGSAALEADWVVIGPPDLLEAARGLVEWRQKQGLVALSVPLAAIYDQFGDGFPEPEAIQRFLQATRAWARPPRSVLLLGDASYDPIGYLAPPEANRLPVFLVYTPYGGETGSDLPFADLDGDHRPDLAIGRFPARTPEQVKLLVDKTLRFEADLRQPDTWRLFAVADGQEEQFAGQAQDFLNFFPAPASKTTHFPAAGAAQAAVPVQQAFNQGVDLVVYVGHGSLNMWGKDRIFAVEDAAKLTNRERQPLLLQFTCLAGLFTHPKRDSLSETLLWLPNAGVVAALAPTSLTNGTDQEALSHPLAQALAGKEQSTLGAALLAAWRQMPLDANSALLDVLNTFVLLGDPELRIKP